MLSPRKRLWNPEPGPWDFVSNLRRGPYSLLKTCKEKTRQSTSTWRRKAFTRGIFTARLGSQKARWAQASLSF